MEYKFESVKKDVRWFQQENKVEGKSKEKMNQKLRNSFLESDKDKNEDNIKNDSSKNISLIKKWYQIGFTKYVCF